MTTEPDRKTVGYRVAPEVDAPPGDVNRRFSTRTDGQGVPVRPAVAVTVGPPAEAG